MAVDGRDLRWAGPPAAGSPAAARRVRIFPQGAVPGSQYLAFVHAREEIIAACASQELVIKAIDTGRSFAYFQNGAWQTGFYDAATSGYDTLIGPHLGPE